MSSLKWAKSVGAAIKGAETVILAASETAWKEAWHVGVLDGGLAKRASTMIKSLSPGTMGSSRESYDAQGPTRLVVITLPDRRSRHNAPSRIEELWGQLRSSIQGGKVGVILGLDAIEHLQGASVAVARSMPLYSRKTGKEPALKVQLCAVDATGEVAAPDTRLKSVVDSVRESARLVDMPTAELDTAGFVKEARRLVKGIPNVTTKVIVGDALLKEGLGGIHGVGRAAAVAPRLLILDYKPTRPTNTIALVGKGVVYDTGGLSLKSTLGMCGMKADMGGGAAVLGAFRVLATSKVKRRIIALVPLAENANDANSYRNDDILELHSGHTVEINNTDAEGRLLLGDAVSYAARKYKPDAVMNAATLTGAQLISTGDAHAAIVSSRPGLEQLAVAHGRETGELTWPLPFVPELYQLEFSSVVADMRNSVKNRSNAQCSCAAQFVWSHIDDLDIPWLHVDLAGPAVRHGRGTGFGVGLLASLAEHVENSHLLEQ